MPSATLDMPSRPKEDRHRSKEEKKRKRDRDEDAVPAKKSKKHRSDKDAAPIVIRDEPEAEAPSPFHIQTSTQYLPLAPVSQRHPLEGFCAEHLSPLLLQYHPPFHGIVLSYSNVRISENPYGDDGPIINLKSVDEYGVSWAWVTADFVLFKPMRGATLEGYVNLQNEGHIGIVCWNLFNASIERARLPKDWQWVQTDADEDPEYAQHHFVDGEGNKVEGMIKFKIQDIECSHDRQRGFVSISGTMLPDDEENSLLQQEAELAKKEVRVPGKRLGGSKAPGATILGVPIPREEGETRPNKRRLGLAGLDV